MEIKIRKVTSSKIILFIVIYLYFGIPASAQKETTIQDSLLKRLETTTDQEERYMLWRHLSDITTVRNTRFTFIRHLFEEAYNAGNEEIQIEALLELSNYENIDSLQKYIAIAEKLPVNPATKGLLILLKGRIANIRIRNFSEEEKLRQLNELMEEYKTKLKENTDIYDRILHLRILCTQLSYSMIRGDIYTQFMEEQQELVEQLPPENYYLKATILIQLALSYTYQEEYAKATETDKKQLEYIHEREKVYQQQGRIYRNYYNFYYSIYRRMLSNYPALTRAEVDSCYNRLKELCNLSQEVKEFFYQDDLRSHLYYYMATGQYEKALPYLEALSKNDISESNKVPLHVLLRYKIETYKALGQKDKQLAILEEYITALNEYMDTRAKEKYQEMQVLYDVQNLNNQNASLMMRADRRKILLITSVACMVTLLFIVLLIFHLHTRRLVGCLKHSEQALQDEKKNLIKTQQELVLARDQAQASDRIKTIFIQNMSHEIRTPLNAIVGFAQLLGTELEGKDRELKEYTHLICSNSELLLTLVNDLLQLSDIEAGKLNLSIGSHSVNELCRTLLDSVAHRVSPEVKMTFTPACPGSFYLETDALRLQQILLNLLCNAAKFTTQGQIDLAYRIEESEQQIVFSVTDTGPGVPPEKADQIFERFEKLNPFAQGNGLGLHICRLLADLLGATVKLDTTYTSGARFLLIHPLHPSSTPETDHS